MTKSPSMWYCSVRVHTRQWRILLRIDDVVDIRSYPADAGRTGARRDRYRMRGRHRANGRRPVVPSKSPAEPPVRSRLGVPTGSHGRPETDRARDRRRRSCNAEDFRSSAYAGSATNTEVLYRFCLKNSSLALICQQKTRGQWVGSSGYPSVHQCASVLCVRNQEFWSGLDEFLQKRSDMNLEWID